jgi:hypothetical protein
VKKIWIIIITLFGVCVIGGYAVLDNIFPKADPIILPSKEDITTISLIQNNGSSVTVESEEFEYILQYISNAQPTRTMSVNDYPATKTYYTVEVTTPERVYRHFIYADNSQVYIEIPYEGVYKSNQQFLDFLKNIL